MIQAWLGCMGLAVGARMMEMMTFFHSSTYH